MDLDETGLSALANFADAAVASPGEFESLAEAAISDARRFDSPGNASALASAIDVVGATLASIAAAPEARTVETMLRVARVLRERDDGLAREAGRALVWALENRLLSAARHSARPIPSGLHPLDQDQRERSRPVSIHGFETRRKL
ncbi:MAG: hypothetical protein R6X02_02715 [Enhygromyxa sp.]